VFVQRIANELRTPLLRSLPKGVPHKILSIDMGIRNLALCHLHAPSCQTPPVKITNWERLAISEKPDPDSAMESESFEPIDLAAKAYSVIKQSLEKYNPHTVLIERQRYRSAGCSSILEWTVRVNMLEAMFHAVLYTVAQQCAQFNFVVHSVSPRRMTQFWLDDIEEKLNSRQTKLAKVGIAKEIVAGKRIPISFSGEAEKVAKGFDLRIRGSSGERKFDDLADSLLQGLGWLRWNNNRASTFAEIMRVEDRQDSEPLHKMASTRRRLRVTEIDTPQESAAKSSKKKLRNSEKGIIMTAT
jgi:cruciform cutting endonuclease 1